MGGIIDFFDSLKESRKKQVIFFCVSMSLVICIYLLCLKQVNKIFDVIEDDFSWVYQVDSIEEKDDKLQIKGWAFALNENASQGTYEIILCDTKTGKGIYPKMTYESRNDVNEYFLCEYDYTDSGFVANVSTKRLELENTVYEILLRPEGERKAFATNVYYSNGEMVYIHPDEFVPLEVAGTDLEEVIENGVLRVYRPDYGMYVYQYEGELYWIAEPDYGFVNGDTCIEYHMNTTQVAKLPEDRLANYWFWSNLKFGFQTKELFEWNTGRYRVAKYHLPKEYSITHIWTGNYNISEWIWKSDFRPWYVFSGNKF